MNPNFLENSCKKNYPGDAKALATIKRIGEVVDKSIDNFVKEKKKKKEEEEKKKEKKKKKVGSNYSELRRRVERAEREREREIRERNAKNKNN